ncbi:hypothetical protein [Amorphus orientalis]|uniref:Uncharacterized protein n=1 Tax=Amorphus orientalis TaxID=649198 RepID=A0AAE3VMQ1_9HYPH|nr:hypothetical protein [Amorphus orientalis]MDQ0314882.1 hypothetical protein [Amorphus orientalis]
MSRGSHEREWRKWSASVLRALLALPTGERVEALISDPRMPDICPADRRELLRSLLPARTAAGRKHHRKVLPFEPGIQPISLAKLNQATFRKALLDSIGAWLASILVTAAFLLARGL